MNRFIVWFDKYGIGMWRVARYDGTSMGQFQTWRAAYDYADRQARS